MNRVVAVLATIVTVTTIASCGEDDSTSSSTEVSEPALSTAEGDELFPDLLHVTSTQADDGTWSFNVTISSPYDSPERYADAW